MGRSWERIIRTVKEAMFAIIKDRILTGLQVLKLFSEVENIINNRPLTYLMEDHVKEYHVFKDVRSRKKWWQVQILSDHF